jgi:methylmalonyl-CoA/ethylmalonyl-CoA epimerase
VLSNIHHTNIVVADLVKSIDYFAHLLQQEPIIENLPQRSVNTARFKIGESLLVLVQPLTNEGLVADILASRGEGVFLLSFASESIDDTLSKLELNNTEKRTGLDGWPICDISPLEQFGVILQLTETPKNHSK